MPADAEAMAATVVLAFQTAIKPVLAKVELLAEKVIGLEARWDDVNALRERVSVIETKEVPLLTPERGEKGDHGEPGPIGPAGERGEKGADGLSTTGERGEKGDTGDAGLHGLTGPEGPTGPPGERGLAGEGGLQGAAGLNGADGKNGAPGAEGPAGPPGPPGAPGPTGEKGVEGLQGLRGPEGPTARDGRDGLSGVQGPQGEKGLDGLRGADGVNGRDGTLDNVKLVQLDERTWQWCFKNGEPVEGGIIHFDTELYRGVWVQSKTYERGDCTTWGGSEWHCNETTLTKPGDSATAWTLKVKRGRDGKDAAPITSTAVPQVRLK